MKKCSTTIGSPQFLPIILLLLIWLLPSIPAHAKNSMPWKNSGYPAATPPDWSVNPIDFEFSMNMLIRVKYNGTNSNAPDNLVGVFVGDELRGVATPTISGGIAYYFVKVYSKSYSGEVLNFKVYYAADDLVYPTMEEAVFRHNKFIGTPVAPFFLNVDSSVDLPPALEPFPDFSTLDGIPFEGIDLPDYLLSVDDDPVTWTVQAGPNFSAIVVNNILTVSYTPGTLPLPYSEPVIITATEINPPNNFAISDTVQFTVLEDYGPPVWQGNLSQTVFKGNSFSDFDLDNFLVFNGPCHAFDFEVFPDTGSVADPGWPVVAPGPDPMILIARPLYANKQLAGTGAKLAAFVNGSLAGWATPNGISPDIYYELEIQDVGAGPVTFQFYDAENQFLHVKNSTLTFVPGSSTGSQTAPYEIQLAPLVPVLSPAGEVQIEVVDAAWTGSFPVDFIVWDCDYPAIRRATTPATFGIVSDIRPHINTPASNNFQENACYTLYDANTDDVNDTEGAGLTYALDGGEDVLKFSIDPVTGVLTWVPGFIPDFENPDDLDQNNQYQVNIKVTNSSNFTDNLSITITVTDQQTEPFTTKINSGDAVICNSGGTTLQATGGDSYLWNTGAVSSSIDVSMGTYTVTVTSSGACTGTAAVTVTGQPTVNVSGNSDSLCLGTLIHLTSITGAGIPPYSFSWSGPDFYTSDLQNPSDFPATSQSMGGLYTVLVTDILGCTATATTNIKVSSNTLPDITATVSGSPACAGTVVNLSAMPSGGSGSYTTFRWSGPNGYNSVVQNPPGFSITSMSAGAYTVTVTDNKGCKATGSTTLAVNPKPEVLVDNGLALDSISVGQTLSLTATASGGSGAGYAYTWSGPEGFNSSDQNPSRPAVLEMHSGFYKVVVTDSEGCSKTDSTKVSVIACPGISATPGSVCTGGSIQLQSTPTGGAQPYASFNWAGPGGYSETGQNPPGFPVSFAALGTYTVTITDRLGCTATATTEAVEHDNPVISATNSSNPAGVCTGSNVTLSSTPSGGSGVYSLFSWTGVDGYVASVEDPATFTTSLASAGLYQVTVTDSQGCTGSATTTVFINQNPTATASSNATVCVGQPLNLMSTTSNGVSPFTYKWTGPDGFGSTDQNPTITPPNDTIPLTNAGIYRVTVTDSKGCTATAFTPVTISVTAPPSVTVENNGPLCSGDPLNLLTTVSGGSGIYPSYTWSGPNSFSAATANPTLIPAYMNAAGTYSVTVTDSHNCKSTASTTVSVNGAPLAPSSNEASNIFCPGTTIQLMAGGPGGAGWTYSWKGPNNFTSSLKNPPGIVATPAAAGEYKVTVTATVGICVNSVNVAKIAIEVGDITPPVISCPANTTVQADAMCSGVVGTYSPVSVSDNCNPNPAVMQSPIASSVFSGLNGVQIVTLTANDGNGNTASCSFSVTLKDLTPPSITCPVNTTIAADANCSGTIGMHAPQALTDNCNPNPAVTQSPVESMPFSGLNTTETVTLTANDGSGNTASCSFSVTLKDQTPPSITCPNNKIIAADGTCSGVLGAYSPASLSDNCTLNPTVTQDLDALTVLSGHDDFKTVTLTATDDDGNLESCTFTVTLKDLTPPSLSCPADMTLAADAACSASLGAYSATMLSDNCAMNPTVTQSPDAATILNGHNDIKTVTLTADDHNGNTSTCTFAVTLKDTTMPVIICPANMTIAADNNCSAALGAYSAASASDNCTNPPMVTQSPDATTVLSGHNDLETVTLTVDDSNGNTASCNFSVTLKDITPPTVVCRPFTAELNAAGTVGVSTSDVFDSGADNCGTVNHVSVVPNAYTCGNLGENLVVLAVNDGNGNTATCQATVTVVDLLPPVMRCIQDTLTLVLNTAGRTGLTVADCNDGSSDNCTLVSLGISQDSFTCSNLGVNTLTLTGEDQSGNTSTCAVNIMVIDTLVPIVRCKNDTLSLNKLGESTLTVPMVDNGSTDNCTIDTLVLSQTAFTCANLGNNIVTLHATDQSGNSSQCTAAITVLDQIFPTANCKSHTTVFLGMNGTFRLPPSTVDSGSTDNCHVVRSLTPAIFNCGHLGVNTVTFTITDASGNSDTCLTSVTVRDTLPPTAICRNLTVSLSNADNAGQVIIDTSQVDKNSIDNCHITKRLLNRTTFGCSDLDAPVDVILTLIDQSGNTSDCIASITVRDTFAPKAQCEDIEVGLVNGFITVYSEDLAGNSVDNCSISSFIPNDTTYTQTNIGINFLNITVRDSSGNEESCTSVITILPDMRPIPSSKPNNRSRSEESNVSLLVYPNPAAGDVLLEFYLPSEQSYRLRVFDLMGHLVFNREGFGIAGKNTIFLKRGFVLSGVYFLSLEVKDGYANKRLIIQD